MPAEWRFKAEYIKNCNCAPGCPCDFWAPPTHGPCQGMMAFHILSGNYGTTKLDGAIVGGTYHWPGALHLGNGTFQPYLLDTTTPAQREALLTIMSGKAGGAWFEVLASVVSTVLDPKFVPMQFEFNLNARHARVSFGNEVQTVTEPIKNIATGDEHHIQVDMPNGMEYKHPEIATSAVLRSTGSVRFDCPGCHSSLAVVEQTHRGLVA
ncbi:MAG TPA: DUF1326 domain-containing protein [Terriglobales bacterium]|nr:DUF1326 domain-containing protein [Terriglobales bacterium]